MQEEPTRIVSANPAFGWLRPPEAADEIGRLAHYRLLKVLGRGGMGIVFEAEDVHLGRRVALKVIRPDVAADDEVRSRFLREARAAATLKNDHVVTIYHVGEDAGVPFLAMELLRGRSLDAWLKPDRRATVAELLILGKQIARGLASAHTAGLIHRDIKPANLWLEAPRARLKILDFGLARIADGTAERLTDHGELLGTPSFMPPEHLRGEEVDHRGDLFSFGCVLYRMSTGVLPFTGDSISAVLHAITTHNPVPVGTFNPNVPARLGDLIGRMLAKPPLERPASAQAVLDDLQGIEKEWKQEGADNLPAEETSVDSTVAYQSGGAFRWWIAAAVVAAAVLVPLGWMSFGRDAEPIGNIASDPVDVVEIPVASTPRTVDLLALINVERDQMTGRWVTNDRRLRGEAGKDPGRFQIAIPWDPPEEYRLRADVTRLRPKAGNFSLGLTTRDQRFTVVIDHPIDDRGRVAHTAVLLDGRSIEEREKGQPDRALRTNEMVSLTCTVRRNGVQVLAGETMLFEWQGDIHRLQRRNTGPAVKLFLGGSHEAAFEIERLILEPLGDDPGRPI